jgi:Nitrate and nitrite sensing
VLSKDAPSRADEPGADAPPPERRPGPGFRAGGAQRAPQKRPLGIRDLRIRNKVVVVLLLPVLTVLALGGLRITTSMQDYLQSGHIRQFAELSTRATSAAHELQTEYLDAIQFLLAKQPADLATYKNQMGVTDAALNGYKSARDTARGHLNADARALVDEVDRQLSGLSELRADLVKGAALPLAATSYRYPALINRLIGLKQEAALGSGNHQLAQSVQAASAYTSGKEYLTEGGALLIEVFSTSTPPATATSSARWPTSRSPCTSSSTPPPPRASRTPRSRRTRAAPRTRSSGSSRPPSRARTSPTSASRAASGVPPSPTSSSRCARSRSGSTPTWSPSPPTCRARPAARRCWRAS